MPVRPAPSLTLVVLTLIAGGCAKLHHQEALTWRLVVELDHSVPDIQTATAQRFSSWTQNNINQYVGVVLI
jgi:hypothetical protein